MGAVPALSLERRVANVWRFRLTATGKCVLLGVLVSGSVGSASLDIPVYRLFCALLSLYITTYVAGFIMRPRLRMAGALPERGEAGQPIQTVYTIHNVGTRMAYDVGVRHMVLPPGLQQESSSETFERIAPGQSAQVTVTLLPLRRGVYTVEPALPFTSFPFNLFRLQARYSDACAGTPTKLVVTPPFHPLEGVGLPLQARYQPGGIALTSNVGESPEYIGNRDYRPGDPTRRIDFRAWGRLTKPVVREYQEEYYSRVGLILDTCLPVRTWKRGESQRAFDAAISLAAAIAEAMARGEYIIDLFAAGSQLYVFRAGRHTAHIDNILEILACVEPTRKPMGPVLPDIRGELQGMSAIFCVFLRWDRRRAELVQAAREAGCTVRVLLIDVGASFEKDDNYYETVLEITPEQVFRGPVGLL